MGDRRSIRLHHYDYSQSGAYFVTICTHDRDCLFGNVLNGQMVLNECGKIADGFWREIPDHFPHVALDVYIIMPNHIHGIVMINGVGAKNFLPLQLHGTSRTIGSIVRGFKIGVTKWCRKNTDRHVVWQRNYYEHIIRDDAELNRVRQYIIDNPSQWDTDSDNPKNIRSNKGVVP